MSIALPAIPSAFVNVAVKRRRNTWYSIKDGNWTDPTVWRSAYSGGIYPCYFAQNHPVGLQGEYPAWGLKYAEDVVISHTVTWDTPVGASCVANNLVVNPGGKLVFGANNNKYFHVMESLQVYGTLNMSQFGQSLALYGYNNRIDNPELSGNSAIKYMGELDQEIMDITYQTLWIGASTKWAKNHITVLGDFRSSLYNRYYTSNFNFADFSRPAVLELGNYNLYIDKISSIAGGGFRKTGSGTITFGGPCNFQVGSGSTTFDCSGNPDVEFRGGLVFDSISNWNSGTGTWKFSTADQTAYFRNKIFPFNGPVVVDNVTVTNGATSTAFHTSAIQINNSLNGTTAASKWLNQGNIQLNNGTGVVMTTGSMDLSTNTANVVGYVDASNYTLPYSDYAALYINGTATKTIPGNTVVRGNLQVGMNVGADPNEPTLALAGANLVVNGTTNIGVSTIANKGHITKTGAGSITFNGAVGLGTALTTPLNLSGNPTVELKGGITISSLNAATVAGWSGTGQWTFSSSQSITIPGNDLTSATLDAPVLVSGANTLTNALNASMGSTSPLILNSTIDGDNAGAVFKNLGKCYYKGAAAPMATLGSLDCNSGANIFKYNAIGNQDVKGGTYRTLEFGGSGVKKLLGNVIVNTTAGGSWSITGTASIDYNGFTITTI